METVPSFWSRDPCEPMGQSQHEAYSLWDCQYEEGSVPSVSFEEWTELSPHLQRNKQLHDTLLQREEELARLQEENHKLRQFLNSSFVKDLEEKAKKLYVDGRRKRNTSSSDTPISKRVCRNLTPEFCSKSETSECSLELWVLRTLGLKDRDTIDTTVDNHVSATYNYHSPVYASGTSSNAYHSPLTADTLQTVPSQRHDTKDTRFQNSCLDLTTSHEYTSFGTAKSQSVEQQELFNFPSPLQTTISYSPLKRLHFSCSSPKKSGSNQNAGDVPSPVRSPCSPWTPNSGPDLAFSMCLSPNHSLKTHSFAQGQAFVRRDTQGRCSFTWVPRERP